MQACPNMQACACASTSNKTGVNLEHASTSMDCRNCRMNINLTIRGHPFCDLGRLPFYASGILFDFDLYCSVETSTWVAS